jgi:hypothetical protein
MADGAFSIEQITRITARARLNERVKIATLLTARADTLRGEGKLDVALELDVVATELNGGRQIVEVPALGSLAPTSPFGASVAHDAPVADNDDGSGLPPVQFNSDEDDAMRVLHAQGTLIARSNMLRD